MEKRSKGVPVLKCILFLIAIPLVTWICAIAMVFGSANAVFAFASPLLLALIYFIFRKKLIPAAAVTNGVFAAIVLLALTVLFIAGRGNTDGTVIHTGLSILGLIFPPVFLMGFMDRFRAISALFIVIHVVSGTVLPLLFLKNKTLWKRFLPGLAFAAALIAVCAALYATRPSVRYAGHGFDYMHGYSSTDFTDYMVYSEHSKLASLDHEPAFTIDREEDMAILDGAEACYPLYAAVAKAVYHDIDKIEREYLNSENADLSKNGKIVRFTNTVQAFYALISRDPSERADLLFGARPSEHQLFMAEGAGISVTATPIGREAFVFFTEEDNPVSSLTSDEIRAIYHGDIVNWSEVGGKDEPIVAFQRPADSGSQAMMEVFMGSVSLKEPKSYEYVDSMAGVTQKTAQYANERGALGYSFRYFVEDLNQEKGVKVLAVDGVAPTIENIRNGSYPLTVPLCVISRTDDPNENVQKMIDFMLSPDGQELVEKTGYAGLR